MQPSPYHLQSHRLVEILRGFVPTNVWFEQLQERRVAVQAFAVYRHKFDRMPYLPSAPLVMDFPLLRAVLGRTKDFFYPDPELVHLFPSEDGRFIAHPNQVLWTGPDPEDFRYLEEEELYRSTGDAPMLFLMTPFSTGMESATTEEQIGEGYGFGTVYEFDLDEAAKERLMVSRAAIVTVLGRNAAFEMLFDFLLEFSDDGSNRRIFLTSSRQSPTTFEPPKIDGFSAEQAQQVFEKIYSRDFDSKNRLLLALRWYLFAQRNPLSKDELLVDVFISYWIALESLTGTKDPVSATRNLLAEIHNLSDRSPQHIENNLFPIGRIFGLRSKIVHQRHVPEITDDLLKFMDDLFVNVLLHTLDLPSAYKTNSYLDGSVVSLLSNT